MTWSRVWVASRVVPFDRGDDVAGLETGLVGRATGDDRRLRGGTGAGLTLAAALAERIGALAERVAALATLGVGVLPGRALRGRRVGGRDPGAVVDGQAVRLLDRRIDGLEPDAEPRAGQRLAGRRLGQQRAGDVDRDREADALAVAGDRRC